MSGRTTPKAERRPTPPADGSISGAVGAVAHSGRALYQLFDSELALTGHALIRAALIAVLAIALAGVCMLLLAGLFVLVLQAMGLSWLASLSVATLLSGAACSLAILHARQLLDLCGIPATRRQLALVLASDDDADGTDSDGAGTGDTDNGVDRPTTSKEEATA